MYVHRACKLSGQEIDREKKAGGFCAICGQSGTVFHVVGTNDYYQHYLNGVLYFVSDGEEYSTIQDVWDAERTKHLATKANRLLRRRAEEIGRDKRIPAEEAYQGLLAAHNWTAGSTVDLGEEDEYPVKDAEFEGKPFLEPEKAVDELSEEVAESIPEVDMEKGIEVEKEIALVEAVEAVLTEEVQEEALPDTAPATDHEEVAPDPDIQRNREMARLKARLEALEAEEE
jgi:hypothetical protein